MYKDMLGKINQENKTLKEEIEKMKQTVDKIRTQYKTLKADITSQNQKKENQKQLLDAVIQTDFPTLMPLADEDEPSASESPETEDDEKKKLDEYLSEFLDNSLNMVAKAKPEVDQYNHTDQYNS